MEHLKALYYRLLSETNFKFKRYIYDEIDWDDRLIIIKGAKGVGKTTLMLQHIKETFKDSPDKALFASLDHVWFSNNSILDIAEYHYTHGGTHLFLDEVHKYANWQQEIKNIYDYYPKLSIVITGSSMLQIDASITADLSRRYVAYELDGLSFREYLRLEGVCDLQSYTIEDILKNHSMIAASICNEVKVLPYFEKYLKEGFYPYYKESIKKYHDKLEQSLVNVIESDIPAVAKIDYNSVRKIKQLMAILSQQTPYTLNITMLSRALQVSRNTLVKLIDLLDSAKIMRKLIASPEGMGPLTKPEKLLFNNTNIMFALSKETDSGTLRETFSSSQLSHRHHLSMPTKGDILVDGRYLFEIGGRKKGYKQIKDINESYVIADDIEIGAGNKIPMWLLGLLY